MEARIVQLPLTQLDLLEPLWNQLNLLHHEDSVYFKEHYETLTFERRVAPFRSMTDESLHLVGLMDTLDQLVGYCIATVHHDMGEIESLYLDAAYRGSHYGQQLLDQGMAWLKSRNCTKIRLSVSYGHEEVFGFYMKQGFFPRMTVLEWKG